MGVCSSKQTPIQRNQKRRATAQPTKSQPTLFENQNEAPTPLTFRLNTQNDNAKTQLLKKRVYSKIPLKVYTSYDPISDRFSVFQTKERDRTEGQNYSQIVLQNNLTGINYDVIMFENTKENQTISQGFIDLKNHPCIVSIEEIIINPDRFYIILEKCQGPSLKKYISQLKKLEQPINIQLIYQILEAIGYLHSQSLPYGNLSLKAFKFLDKDCQILKLVGLQSLFVKNTIQKQHARYMSPEQADLTKEKKTIQNDIWACGAIILHMLTLQRPYRKYHTVESIYREIQKNPISNISIEEPQYQKLLKNMLEPNEADRSLKSNLTLSNDFTLSPSQSIRQYNYLEQCFVQFLLYKFSSSQVTQLWLIFRKYQQNDKLSKLAITNILKKSNLSENQKQQYLDFFFSGFDNEDIDFEVFTLYFCDKSFITQEVLEKVHLMLSTKKQQRITQAIIEQYFVTQKASLAQCLSKYVKREVQIPNLTFEKFREIMNTI